MSLSSIEWTHYTFNPWWGCAHVSPGCTNCYAESMAKRYGHAVWGKPAPRRFLSDAHWREPLKWNREVEKTGKHLVFCASMADVFESREDLQDERWRLWDLIESTPNLTWQLLTKRPENVMSMVPSPWSSQQFPPNVWLGCTVEDQARAEERIPWLLKAPARTRFLSCEPLLEPLDLWPWLDPADNGYESGGPMGWIPEVGIHWVIVGGESGPGARPFHLAWARHLVTQCRSSTALAFVKQLGAKPVDGDLITCGPLGAVATVDYPVRLKSRKGGDWSEWPEDLRVREMPGRVLA